MSKASALFSARCYELFCTMAMALRRLLSLAATGCLPRSDLAGRLSPTHELGRFALQAAQDAPYAMRPAQTVPAALVFALATVRMRSTDATPPATPDDEAAAGAAGSAAARQVPAAEPPAADSRASSTGASSQAAPVAGPPSGRQGQPDVSRRARPPLPPPLRLPSKPHPFAGTRKAPSPAPSAGGMQAEALTGALGPPQYECIGRVSGRYSVERTPEFAIVELGPAQYKVVTFLALVVMGACFLHAVL